MSNYARRVRQKPANRSGKATAGTLRKSDAFRAGATAMIMTCKRSTSSLLATLAASEVKTRCLILVHRSIYIPENEDYYGRSLCCAIHHCTGGSTGWNLRFGTSGEVVAKVFVVVWCAMCAIEHSFSLLFLCLFAWLDCTVADKHSYSVISRSDDHVF
jgi:hypothetical protein